MSIVDEYTKQMYECYQSMTGGVMHVSVDDFIKLRKEAVKEIHAGFSAGKEAGAQKQSAVRKTVPNEKERQIARTDTPVAVQPQKTATIAPIRQQEEPIKEKAAVNAFSLLRSIPDNWN